ncbi:hypothetical protein CDV36_009863 [Fusarium kuroshium]|uniref:Uncharacterized protein n=1 Tax=Fusarium kuroshium TaxID=2010991 RepID=A0A3M2RYW4_9HYPO|nr:hypothetical protein CDV36_009863 [Fusarium kuroshium]
MPLIKRAPSSRAPHGGDTSTSQTQSYNTEDDSSAETSNDYTDSDGESYGSYDEDEEDIGPSDSASTSDHEGHYARPQRLPPQQRQHQLPPAGQYGQQYPPQHPNSTQHQSPPQHQLPPQQHQLPPHQPPRHQLTPHQALQPHQPPPTEYGPEYGLEEEPQPQPQPYRRPSRRERPPKTATLDDPRYPAYGRGGFPHPTAPGRPGPGQFFGRGQTGFQNHVGPYMGYPANSQMVPFGYDPNNPYDPYGGEGRGMYDMMPYQGQQQQQPPGFYGAMQPHQYGMGSHMQMHLTPPPPPPPIYICRYPRTG